MASYARHRVGNVHALQSGAVQERDVSDRLDVLSPVDRLQRRAVVEKPVAVGPFEFAVDVRVLRAVPTAVLHARQGCQTITQSHRLQSRTSRKDSLSKRGHRVWHLECIQIAAPFERLRTDAFQPLPLNRHRFEIHAVHKGLCRNRSNRGWNRHTHSTCHARKCGRRNHRHRFAPQGFGNFKGRCLKRHGGDRRCHIVGRIRPHVTGFIRPSVRQRGR